MEEEDDDDEWRPQQFYLDVISETYEPIDGELSGQFPSTAWTSTDLFIFIFIFLFCFVLFCCLGVLFSVSVCPSEQFPGTAQADTNLFFFFFGVFFYL
jgi:hypothetical protein